MKPIVVPAFTRDPDEECYCPYCNEETMLVHRGNKFVCPNGHKEADVLILQPLERTYCKDCVIGVMCLDYDPPDNWCHSIAVKHASISSKGERNDE